MNERLNKYQGIFPAFYACYNKDGSINTQAVEEFTEYLIGKGVHGLYVGGSSGECIYQSVEERKLVLEHVMKVAKGRIVIIAHIACNNTADSKELADIAIGNELVISGTRANINDTQVCIDNARLVTNSYGSHDIPEGAIVTNAAIGSLTSGANTTAIYKVTAKIKYVESQYSKTYELVVGETGYQLYSSNALTQYKMLDGLDGKTVDVLVSVVNWNGKGYKLCAIGVISDGVTVYNEFSFGG